MNKEYVVENTTYNSMTAMFSFAKPNVDVNISDAYLWSFPTSGMVS